MAESHGRSAVIDCVQFTNAKLVVPTTSCVYNKALCLRYDFIPLSPTLANFIRETAYNDHLS